jgi:hypothetical protein
MEQPVPSAVTVVGTEQSMATSYGPGEPKSVTAGKVSTQDAASAEPFVEASPESSLEASLETCEEASSELEPAPASPSVAVAS